MRPDGKNATVAWPWFGGSRMAPGPFLEEDANTVAHVYWDGLKLVDTKGNAWTMNGSVPQVTGSPLFPTGFAPATRSGAGPYSAVNNYQGPTSLMEWAGDWSATALFTSTSFAAIQIIIAKLTSIPDGWAIRTENTGAVSLQTNGTVTSTANVSALNMVTIVSVGRSAGSVFVKLNGGTTATAAIVAGAAPAEPARIGRYGAAGVEATATVLHELVSTTTPWVESTITAIHSRFSQQGPRYAK